MSEKIKIEVEVTPIQMAQIAQIVFGVSLTEDQPKTPAKKPKKAEKADKPVEEAPKEPEAEEEPEEPEAEVSLDEIRAAMSKKVGDHRDKIKKYLESVDAKNVSTLPEDKYGAFYKFLKEL